MAMLNNGLKWSAVDVQDVNSVLFMSPIEAKPLLATLIVTIGTTGLKFEQLVDRDKQNKAMVEALEGH